MKKYNVYTALCFCAVFCLLISCPSGDNINPEPQEPDDELTIVTQLDLTSLVGFPIAGWSPPTVQDSVQYSIFITWLNEDGSSFPFNGLFAKGTVYQATVALDAADGYTFSGFTGEFTHDKAETISQIVSPGGGIVVSITFEATGYDDIITDITLSDLVTAPVLDATPQATFTDQDQYTGTIAWYASLDVNHTQFSSTPFTGTFVPGVTYKAVLTLSPKGDYTFMGVPANSFIYEPSISRYDVLNEEHSSIVSIIFKPLVFRHLLSSANSALTINVCCGYEANNWGMLFSPSHLIEGIVNDYTFWHAEWTGGGADGHQSTLSAIAGIPAENLMAHYITYDLGTVRDIAGLAYHPTNDGVSATWRAPLRYDVFISDTVDIGFDPAESGVTLVGGGSFEAINPADGTNRFFHWQSIDLTKLNNNIPVSARYVQLRIYSSTRETSSAEESIPYPSAAELTIAVNVDPAELSPIIVTKNLDLTNLLTAPAAGAMPQTTIAAQEQYTFSSITWRNNGTDHSAGTAFEMNTVYEAEIVFTARDFFTFNGIASSSFTYNGSTVTTSGSGKTGTVTITFP